MSCIGQPYTVLIAPSIAPRQQHVAHVSIRTTVSGGRLKRLDTAALPVDRRLLNPHQPPEFQYHSKRCLTHPTQLGTPRRSVRAEATQRARPPPSSFRRADVLAIIVGLTDSWSKISGPVCSRTAASRSAQPNPINSFLDLPELSGFGVRLKRLMPRTRNRAAAAKHHAQSHHR